MRSLRPPGGVSNTVDSSVGVADSAQRFIQRHVTTAVKGLAHQQNCTTVFGSVLTKKVGGEPQAVEDRCTVISQCDVVDRHRRSAVVKVMLSRTTRHQRAHSVCRYFGI